MEEWNRKKIITFVSILAIIYLIGGCVEETKTTETPTSEDTKIGDLVETFYGKIAIEGYALVGNLKGTGSSECPTSIRTYLEKYIKQRLPEEKNVGQFIESLDTAVVKVTGFIPPACSKNESFDIKVTALPNTQTTSLEGGVLWGVDLFEVGKLGTALKPIAKAEGPVYIDKINGTEIDKKSGFVLGGGKALEDYKINLVLRKPDYKTANMIRNRLNERFGIDIANPLSSSLIELGIPSEYIFEKQRFIEIVKKMYLVETPQTIKNQINSYIQELAAGEDKYPAEIGLEAVGKDSLGKLEALLNSTNEKVRLYAARCMMRMGNDKGFDALRKIAYDNSSIYRIEAMDAIANSANRNAASAVARRLLKDDNLDIKLAAYHQLLKFNDLIITRELAANEFYIDQVAQTGSKAIFVSRSGGERIVFLGAPIRCSDNTFVQFGDNRITINVPAGGQEASIVLQDKKTVSFKSTLLLNDIIRTLCEQPLKQGYGELRVTYADIAALLKQMCEKGAIQAEFRAGPLPQI